MKQQRRRLGSADTRRWRRRRSRGASDILATILMMAIVVVLATVLLILVEHYTSSSSTTPGLGTSLVLGGPQDSVGHSPAAAACTTTGCNFYNMTIQSAAAGLELHDLVFEIVGQNGTILGPTGGIVVVNNVNTVVASCGFSTAWASGGATPATDLLTIVLYTSGATPLSLSGDTFRVVGTSAFSGSVDVHIF